MAWYDEIVGTTKGNVQGLVDALRNPVDATKQFLKGGEKNRKIASALLQGNTAPLKQAFAEMTPRDMENAMMNVGMTYAPMGIVKTFNGKNLNKPLLDKFIATKKFTPEEFAKYEENAQTMARHGLHEINHANAKANPYYDLYKNQFNIDTWRGMDKDVTAMDPNVGTGPRADTGVWSVDNPYNASTYAGKIQGGVIYPLKLRNQQLATVDVGNHNWNRIPLSSNPVEDTIIRNADDTDYGLHEYLIDRSIFDDFASTNDVASIAKQNLNNKGIKFENVRDIGPSPQGIDTSKIDEFANVYTIFDPSSIRSKFAAFDPLRHKSNDILAGVMALPLFNKDKNK